MRGKTNAIDVGVSVIGEIKMCEVAESSRIEKGEFVETFYRGKTGRLPTPACGYVLTNANSTDYQIKTRNFIAKVPGDNNLFVYATRTVAKGTAIILKLYDFADSEFVEKHSVDCGFLDFSNKNNYMFFVDDYHFVLFGYTLATSSYSILLYKLNEQKDSFTLIQNLSLGFGVGDIGRAFLRNGNILVFSGVDRENLYEYSFNGVSVDESPTLIPITYLYSSAYKVTAGNFLSRYVDIAQVNENAYAYTVHSASKISSQDSYNYSEQVVSLIITEDDNGMKANVKILEADCSSSSLSSSQQVGPFNVARLTDDFFIVNGGAYVSNTGADVVKVYHITEGFIKSQGVSLSNHRDWVESFLEVKDGLVFGFYSSRLLRLLFDAETRTLTYGWYNNNFESSTNKLAMCLFQDGRFFIITLYYSISGDDNGVYKFFTLHEDNDISVGFDGSDNLPNLVRSYSGGKISGIANQSGNEGDIIKVNVPKENE